MIVCPRPAIFLVVACLASFSSGNFVAAQTASSTATDDTSEAQTAAASQDETDAPSTEPAVDSPSLSDPTEKSPNGLGLPTAGTDGSDDSKPLEEDPEYLKELEARTLKFEGLRDELAQALGDMRDTSLRYMNREKRSPADRAKYFEQRDRVRKLMDETYDAALNITRIGFNQDAAQYIVTMVQHRFERNIYDAGTMEGAARMIDGGSKFSYLFQTAARSAVVVGEFEMAERLLDVLDGESLTETDGTLRFNLEEHKKNFAVEKPLREQEAAEDRLPRVLLKTTQGDVVIELFIDQAPSAVSHFITLVEDGFYDGLDFHLVIDNLLALTGDPAGTGTGNSGQFLQDEHTRDDARKAFRGSVVMAKIPMGESGDFIENSGSSQFAILMLPLLSASEQQTVIGCVIEGMDAISRLRRVDPNKEKKKGEIVRPSDSILEATVIRRPEQLPEPLYFDPLAG
ncbi:MAG: peptidylprolyl isomerase [Rubripirellula sp.]